MFYHIFMLLPLFFKPEVNKLFSLTFKAWSHMKDSQERGISLNNYYNLSKKVGMIQMPPNPGDQTKSYIKYLQNWETYQS